jgi:dipeptidyl aminopeptidase/acylaminoacyl peptidase
MAIMGNSSGGWLAVMAALTADESTALRAAVDLYGPTDFLQMDAHMLDDCAQFRAFLGIAGCHDDPGSPESRLVGGPIETRREECERANPVNHVRGDAPPFLIVHGRADPFVPHHQSELLYGALRDHGSEATFYSLPDVGHEHPYVTDPDRAAGRTVYETRGGAQRVLTQSPPPTWETIERFLRDALSR